VPELPEVETIRRGLVAGDSFTPSLLEQRVSDVSILWEKTVARPSPREFARLLRGTTIREVNRRGKYLLFRVDDLFLIFHLRMSGDLSMRRQRAENAPHDRLILFLASGWNLVFNDTRKFGRAWLTPDPQTVLGTLGPEPLDPTLTDKAFRAMMLSRSRQLKPLLMDQSFLAGLGNIYTDESLFAAGLHPLRVSSTLTEEESSKLLAAIRMVLNKGIREHGSSIDWVYRGGNFQNHFQVYQRAGETCPRCGAPVQKSRVGQRGTHFCPVCQPERSSQNV
jgi:formamidopyrimidine-DNA glycosylase